MPQEINKIVLNKALQLLAQRDHSIFELTKKLSLFLNTTKVNINSVVEIDAVIEHCINQNWLDDKLYIERYINMRSRKGYGKYKITAELKQRGLDSEMIHSKLSKSDISWLEIAEHQINKKFHQLDKKDIKQKYRITQFLLHRGFSQDEIQIAYEHCISQTKETQ